MKQLRGSLMLLITALIWGTAFVAQSDGMKYVEPFTYNAVRTLLGGIVLLPVVFLLRRLNAKSDSPQHFSKKSTLRGGILCGVLLCTASSFQQFGIVRTSAGKAGFITALYVLIVPLLGLLLRKKQPKSIWLCAGAALCGFYLLCVREGFRVGSGDLLVLICAVFFALHIMAVDHFCEAGAEPAAMSCIQFFTAGLLAAVCMLIFESPQPEQIRSARLSIAYAGILSSGVAYTLQVFGQRDTPPAAATLLMSLESVFAALSGWLLLNEALSPRELAGCALVFAAVIASQLLSLRQNKQSQKNEP